MPELTSLFRQWRRDPHHRVDRTLRKEDHLCVLPTAGIRDNTGALKEGSGPAVAEDFTSTPGPTSLGTVSIIPHDVSEL